MADRWLVTGATGRLGTILREIMNDSEIESFYISLNGTNDTISCDLNYPENIEILLNKYRPHKVLHLAAISHPAHICTDSARAYRVNVEATEAISRWCHQHGRWMLFASTDHVFSGGAGPYEEADRPRPRTLYGQMKKKAEAIVLNAGGAVARYGWIVNDYSHDRPDFLNLALANLRAGKAAFAAYDELRSPIGARAAAEATLFLSQMKYRSIIHVAGKKHYSPYDLVVEAAKRESLPLSLVRRVPSMTLAPPNRPRDVRLDTTLLSRLMETGLNDARLTA